MRWKKILLIAVLLLVGLFAAIHVFLSTYDFNKFKPRIIQAVREATGRELTLGGDLKVGLGLSASISTEAVSFRNAAWGSQAEMVSVKRIDVRLALWPLIHGTLKFKRLILVEPNFLLEFNQSGESNLDFGGSGAPEGRPPALIFHKVDIEKGTFIYKDDEANKTYRLIVDRLSFGSSESKKPKQLTVKGAFNGRPFQIGGSLGHFALSPAAGEDWPVELSLKFGESEVTIKGEIEDLVKGDGLMLSLLAQGQTIGDVGKLAGLNVIPDLGPFKLASTISGSFHRLAAQDIDFNIGTDKLYAVNISGQIENLLTLQGIKLNITAKGKDLAGLEKRVVQSLPMGGVFSISGIVSDPAPQIYSITELKANLDNNEIVGSIDLDFTAQRPKISTTLSSPKLDLRPILSALDKKGRQAGPSTRGAKKETENFSEESLTKDLMTIADVNLKLHLNNILLPQIILNEIAAQVDLKDGVLTVNLEGPSLPDISELAGVKGVPDLGPFKVAFDVTGPPEKLSIENLSFKTGTPALAALKLTGAIKEPLAQRGIELNCSVRGRDVARLKKFFGRPLPIRGAFSVSGQLVDKDIDIYQLKNISLVLGDNKIDGWTDVTLTGRRPRVSAMFSSQKFNLRPLMLPNIDKFADLTSATNLGPFKLQVMIVDPLGELSLEKLDFQAGTPNLAEIKIEGFIKDLSAWQGVELKFAVKGQEAAELAKLADQTIPITGDFSVSGMVVDSAARVYDLKDFLLVATGSDIRGQMALNLTGQRPRLSAALSSQKIDLAPIFASPEEKSTESGRPVESNTKKQNIIPEIPLTAEALKKADVDVTIRMDHISFPRLSFDDLATHLVLQNGQVKLTAASKSIPDIAELRSLAGPTQSGTVRLMVKASSLRDKLAVEKLDFDAYIEGIVTVKLDATAEDFLSQQGITIDFEAKGEDISMLEKLVGRQLPYTGAFTISGRLDETATNAYKFSALKVIAGDNDIGGWMDLNLTGKRPKIKAELVSQNLDLRRLYPTADQKVAAIEVPATAGKKPKKIFPKEPLPLDVLKTADLDITIGAKKILLPRVLISELTADITLADGHLVVKPFRFSAGNGSVHGYLDLHPEGDAVALALNLKSHHVQLGSTLQEVEVSQVLEGTVDSKINITSQGNSLAALMASLNGSVTLVHQGGRVSNRYFGILFGDLTTEMIKRINVFRQRQNYIDINCTVIHCDINDGMAETVFLVDTPQTKLIGAGKVNLKNETLDLGFKTSPKKGLKVPFWGRIGLSLGELTKPFKVKGTLAQPSFVIDPTRTVVTLGKLTAGLMLGPAGLAIVFADVSKKNADPCREAINALEKEERDFKQLKSSKKKSLLEHNTKALNDRTEEVAQDAGRAINKFFSH